MDDIEANKLQVLQGTLDMLILSVLDHRVAHGYDIAALIQEGSRGQLRVPQGSVSPALKRLCARRYLASTWGTSDSGRKARFYVVTKRGRKHLATCVRDWDRFSQVLNDIVRSISVTGPRGPEHG